MPSTNFHICRLCRQNQLGLFKYGIRAYAHARCGLAEWGADFLRKLPKHELQQFPALLANEFDLLETLESMVNKNET